MNLKKYMPDGKISRHIIFAIAALAVIYMAVHVFVNHNSKYVDGFRTYYYTGKAFNDGLNPHSQADISMEDGFEQRTIRRHAQNTLYVSSPSPQYGRLAQ